MMKKLLTTFAVLTLMTAFAMAQVPLTNSGKITNKGTIIVGCTDPVAGGKSLDNTTTGTITNEGTIKFTGNDPLFANANATVNAVANSGTIQFDGAIASAHDVMTGLGTATDRLEGTVLYDGTSAQQIEGAFYYTNLILSGAGAKSLNYTTGKNYYVAGSYTAAGGDRSYGNSIFHYDGTDQTIFAENATDFSGSVNYYNNLQLDGIGTKTISTGTSILVSTILGDLATAAVTMAEGSKFILKDGITADIAGAITGTGATIQLQGTGTTGTFKVETTGSITFNAGTAASLFEMDGATVTNAGAMTFNAGKYNQKSGHSINSGTITLSGGDYVQTKGLVDISGTMTVTSGTFAINGNTSADSVKIATGGLLNLTASAGKINMAASTNLLVNGNFKSSATDNLLFDPASTVTYNDGAEILVTSLGNSFGNLKLQKTEKNPLGDIYVGTNFTLTGADLNMNQTGSANNVISTLFIKTPSATNVIYGTGLMTDMWQVEGKMNRTIGAGAQNIALVYNNNATKITMTTPGLADLTLNVTPNATAAEIGGDYLASTDVERSIALEYGSQSGWVITMSYGYTNSEAAGLDQALLRYREVLTATTSEKVATGLSLIPSPSVAGSWGSLTLRGIIPGDNTGSLAQVKSGDNLFLRSAPVTFITIADGRWSDPGTWDEGVQPAPTDNTEIKHTVHVGFEGGADAGSGPGQIEERTNWAGANALAQSIVIDNVNGASLVFGSPSAGHNSSSQLWTMNTAGIITNLNQTPNTQPVTNLNNADLASFIAGTTGQKYQGLILFEGNNNGTLPLKLTTQQLVNTLGDVMVGPNTILQICQ